ncbi:MAG: FAD-dependent thymidylate synthase [Dehalococcoidia bacterium]|nr:FAD-dependent thymidylate synthase [Dehalococcoidia bacterium]
MQVALVRYTPQPEETIAAAARLCYSKVGAMEILKKMEPAQVDKLLDHLLTSGHLSPFEHASFTFAIEGLSRAASHQLVRHRLASYSQQSQRYVSLKKLDWVTPPTIQRKPELAAAFQDLVQDIHRFYCRMLDEGVPAEDARYILPNATCTNLVMTMNARELIHVCSVRLCLRAQWEIRELFTMVKAEVEKVSPRIGAELMIKCDRLGYCDEKETCGLYPTKDANTKRSQAPANTF